MVPPFVPVFEVNCWKVKLTQMWIKARVEVFRQIFFPDFCLDLELRGNEVATRRQSRKNPLIASFDVHLINHQWFNEYTEKEILRKHIAPASLSRKKRNGSFGQFLYGGGGWMTQTHSIRNNLGPFSSIVANYWLTQINQYSILKSWQRKLLNSEGLISLQPEYQVEVDEKYICLMSLNLLRNVRFSRHYW